MNTFEKLELAAMVGLQVPHYTNTNNLIDFPIKRHVMHTRIKELALQAGGSHYPSVNSMQLEKFANLIIEDCYGEILCQLYGNNPGTDEQFNAGHEAGLRLAVTTIKKHFGISE